MSRHKGVKEPPRIPDDLGVKVSTKYGAFLENSVLARMEEETERCKFAISLNELLMPVVKKALLEEKKKFK